MTAIVFWCGTLFAEPADAPTQTTGDEMPTGSPVPDYSNWYQVEVLIFAQRTPPESDEIWPEADMTYPADMAAIGPEDDADIKPWSLSQLEQLMAADTTARTNGSPQNRDTEFLFEDKSRFSQDPNLLAKTRTGDRTGTDETGTESVSIKQYFNNDLPRAFREVDPGRLNMNRIARSLTRSSDYRLLSHIAWRQPLDDHDIPVMIQAGDRYEGLYEVDGTLTVSRARYLHVDTDLWFTEFVPVQDRGRFGQSAPPLQTNLSQAVLDQYPQLVNQAEHKHDFMPVHIHPMTQSRRMRSGEVHYLDHPFFGVIIRVDEFDYEPETDR